MPTRKSPRKGSLQFWPRKRANRFLPSVNWQAINNDSSQSLEGFICYKVCMTTAHVKDNTPDSMTKDKPISIPVTILECPPLKIFSVRFYKDSNVATEILAENLDKELKRKIKMPKTKKKLDSIKVEDYDDVRVICYSVVKKTGLKKKPDMLEIGLKGNDINEKMTFIKDNLNKEISILDLFNSGDLIDFRGLTKGFGFTGPVKRFGITLKSHKSEKGRRRPGSLGPWHPARVIFRAPQAGQHGMFTRVVYNNKILEMGKISSENQKRFSNLKNYGNVKTDYIIVKGSVQGPSKRQLVISRALRETKKQKKKSYEVLNVR